MVWEPRSFMEYLESDQKRETTKLANEAQRIVNQDNYLKLNAKIQLKDAYRAEAQKTYLTDQIAVKKGKAFNEVATPAVLKAIALNEITADMGASQIKAANNQAGAILSELAPFKEQGVTRFNKPDMVEAVRAKFGDAEAAKLNAIEVKDIPQYFEGQEARYALTQSHMQTMALQDRQEQVDLNKMEHQLSHDIFLTDLRYKWEQTLQRERLTQQRTKQSLLDLKRVPEKLDDLSFMPVEQDIAMTQHDLQLNWEGLDLNEEESLQFAEAFVDEKHRLGQEELRRLNIAATKNEAPASWQTESELAEKATASITSRINADGELVGSREQTRDDRDEWVADLSTEYMDRYTQTLLQTDPRWQYLSTSDPSTFDDMVKWTIWSDPVARGLRRGVAAGQEGMGVGTMIPAERDVPVDDLSRSWMMP